MVSESNMGNISLMVHFERQSILDIAKLFDLWIADMIHSPFGMLRNGIRILFGATQFDVPFWKSTTLWVGFLVAEFDGPFMTYANYSTLGLPMVSSFFWSF